MLDEGNIKLEGTKDDVNVLREHVNRILHQKLSAIKANNGMYAF